MATVKKKEDVEPTVEVEVEAKAETPAEAEPTVEQTAEPVEQPKKAVENKFSKAKLVGSKRFASRRDILNVKLKDDKQYTISEVEAIIEEFMKGGK